MTIEPPYSIIQLCQQVDNCWTVCNSGSNSEYAISSTINTLLAIADCISEDLKFCRQVKEAGKTNLEATGKIRERASMLKVELPVAQGEYAIGIKISEAEQCESELKTMENEVVAMLRQLKSDITSISADTSGNNGWQKVYTKANINNKHSYNGTDYGGASSSSTCSAGSAQYSYGNHGAAVTGSYSAEQDRSSFQTVPQAIRTQPEYSPNSGTCAYNVSQSTLPRGSLSSDAFQDGDTVKKKPHAVTGSPAFPRPEAIRTNAEAESFLRALAREILSVSSKTQSGFSMYSSFVDDVGNNVRHRPDNFDGDLLHAVIARADGFDGNPNVVTDSEFEKLSAGRMILYRGLSTDVVDPVFTAGDMASEFMHGELFQGVGYYGTGTYSAPRRDISIGYSAGENDGVYGSMLKFLLSDNARVITLDEVYQRQAEILDSIDMSDDVGRLAATLARDVGRCAEILGYDAVALGGDLNNYLVLNRTMLTVSEKYTQN